MPQPSSADLQNHLLAARPSADLDPAAHASRGFDRLHGVDQQIQDHLVDLGRGADHRGHLPELLHHRDLAPLQPAPDQLQAAGDRRSRSTRSMAAWSSRANPRRFCTMSDTRLTPCRVLLRIASRFSRMYGRSFSAVSLAIRSGHLGMARPRIGGPPRRPPAPRSGRASRARARPGCWPRRPAGC